jgi:hypothetical protein
MSLSREISWMGAFVIKILALNECIHDVFLDVGIIRKGSGQFTSSE